MYRHSTRPSICVLGLGYIGLPTASMFAVAGHNVVGVDPSPRVRRSLAEGPLHIEEPDLEALVSSAINSGRLIIRATPEPADVFIIAVPTPFVHASKEADLRFVEQAARDINPHLRTGNLVILESTVPPSTTRDVVAPILERTGLVSGRDFHLAHCPERVLPGRILVELVANDRLAGGMTPACATAAAQLYASFVQGEILRTDASTAEMVKVMENTYRDVNIALANEFALIAERVGVDAWEAIRLANRHPRVSILSPGPGVGGHCIAVDPWFLVQAAPDVAQLIRKARQVNDGMPARVLERLSRLAVPPATIAILGVTYKANVDDVRESPALEIVANAVAAGYVVRLCDPHADGNAQLLAAPLLPLEEAVHGADAVVILVDHAEFQDIQPQSVASLVAGKQVLDTRGRIDHATWRAAGFDVHILGAADSAFPASDPGSGFRHRAA
jgi:UDP-N-acetyl-D-mannosaminuronic acid dehydrogenase